MTINEVLAQANELEPNVYSDETKALWLRELDGRIAVEVLGASPADGKEKEWDEGLTAPAPYDNLYLLYVLSMIHFYNQEYDRYNAARTLFTTAESEYRKWYAREHRTAGKRFQNVI